MALPSFPDLPPLLESSQESIEVRTQLAQFGDGYRQEAEDGLNARKRTSSWAWHLDRTDIDTIETFLETNGVSGFEFTAPARSAAVNFKCTKWSRKYVTGDSDRLEAEFEQIFVP